MLRRGWPAAWGGQSRCWAAALRLHARAGADCATGLRLPAAPQLAKRGCTLCATAPLYRHQVQYDPEATGPRHLVDAVEAVGFEAAPLAGQRLGALHTAQYLQVSLALPASLPPRFCRPSAPAAHTRACARACTSALAGFVDSNRRETAEWRRQFRSAALLTLPVFAIAMVLPHVRCMAWLYHHMVRLWAARMGAAEGSQGGKGSRQRCVGRMVHGG